MAYIKPVAAGCRSPRPPVQHFSNPHSHHFEQHALQIKSSLGRPPSFGRRRPRRRL